MFLSRSHPHRHETGLPQNWPTLSFWFPPSSHVKLQAQPCWFWKCSQDLGHPPPSGSAAGRSVGFGRQVPAPSISCPHGAWHVLEPGLPRAAVPFPSLHLVPLQRGALQDACQGCCTKATVHPAASSPPVRSLPSRGPGDPAQRPHVAGSSGLGSKVTTMAPSAGAAHFQRLPPAWLLGWLQVRLCWQLAPGWSRSGGGTEAPRGSPAPQSLAVGARGCEAHGYPAEPRGSNLLPPGVLEQHQRQLCSVSAAHSASCPSSPLGLTLRTAGASSSCEIPGLKSALLLAV